MLAIRDQAM
jgi:hypothetical protein